MNKTQIQPLVVTRVTKLTVTPVPGILYGSSARQVGQTCDFADTQTSNALTVVVIVGPSAARDTQAGYAPDPGHAGTGTVVATYC